MTRRGEVIEWRSARVGMGRGHEGNPEHTAVIVDECVPKAAVEDGKAVRPAEMGTVAVVQQSVSKPRGQATICRIWKKARCG